MNIVQAGPNMFRLLATPAALFFLASAAWSGEFYEKDGLALRGYDPVAYFSEGKPVEGTPEYAYEYKGSNFRFSSKNNRDSFVADPQHFAPQYGGFCAFGTASGYKAAIDPSAFTIVDDKLYLNYNLDVRAQWSSDISGFIVKADKNWPGVSAQTKIFE